MRANICSPLTKFEGLTWLVLSSICFFFLFVGNHQCWKSVSLFPLSSTFLLSHFLHIHGALFQIFSSIIFPFPLPIFLSSCRPLVSSSAHDELRYKVMGTCLCATSLLIVFLSPSPHSLFPPHLSLYPQPPEYIKSLYRYLFYLYVNAPSHSSPFLLSLHCTESVAICSQFLSLQVISPGR